MYKDFLNKGYNVILKVIAAGDSCHVLINLDNLESLLSESDRLDN